jgi:hypothetical protein
LTTDFKRRHQKSAKNQVFTQTPEEGVASLPFFKLSPCFQKQISSIAIAAPLQPSRKSVPTLAESRCNSPDAASHVSAQSPIYPVFSGDYTQPLYSFL